MRRIHRRNLALRSLAIAGLGALALAGGSARAQPGDTVFTPLRPCRVIDSRINEGTTGILAPGQTRAITLRGKCGIPGLTDDGGREANQATALALNIIAVSPTGVGHLTAWPSNQDPPVASVVNYTPGQNTANGVIVPMCDQNKENPCASGDISFQAAVSSVHLVADVTGYYSKPVMPTGGVRSGAGTGFDNFLCINTVHDVRFGLSSRIAHYADAALLCPAGTWLCSREERGAFANEIPCNTSRNDTTCDAMACDGTCIDSAPDNHRGWTAGPTIAVSGETVNEDGLLSSQFACEMRPAWCCSRDD